MKWGVTKVKHPNKGHTLNKGQKPMYQGVRYSESPLYNYYDSEQHYAADLCTIMVILLSPQYMHIGLW